jgi:hypothetical protein
LEALLGAEADRERREHSLHIQSGIIISVEEKMLFKGPFDFETPNALQFLC